MSTAPYTAAELASILECVKEAKGRVEKIVVSAATEYLRSLQLPPLKRANPAREIAQLNHALQSVLKALSDLSHTSEAFLDCARRDPGSRDPSSHEGIMDCKALNNSIQRFLIENKEGLASPAAGVARPGRPKVEDKRRLLKRLEMAFFIGHGSASTQRGLPRFLTRCAAPKGMKLSNNEGGTNWWDDLRRKKSLARHAK
jgi:hypothetical protein